MKHQLLDTAPKEYFSRKYFTNFPRSPRASLWGSLACSLLLTYMVSAMIHFSDVTFPKYAIAAEIFAWLLFAALLIACIAFNRKDMAFRYPIKYLAATILWFFDLTIDFWLILSGLTIILVGAGGIGVVNPTKGVLITFWSLLLFAGGVVVSVWMQRRMKQRILEGHFRAGGSGFFGDFKWKRKVPAISAAVFAVTMALIPISQILSKLGVGIEWEDSFWPVEMLFAAIFICIFLLLFAYIFAISFIRIYYIKRFGVETPPAPKIPKEYLKRWK